MGERIIQLGVGIILPTNIKSPKTDNELGDNYILWEKGVLDDETV